MSFLAMSVPVTWSRDVLSRDVSPCYLVSRCPFSRCHFSRFQSPHRHTSLRCTASHLSTKSAWWTATRPIRRYSTYAKPNRRYSLLLSSLCRLIISLKASRLAMATKMITVGYLGNAYYTRISRYLINNSSGLFRSLRRATAARCLMLISKAWRWSLGCDSSHLPPPVLWQCTHSL